MEGVSINLLRSLSSRGRCEQDLVIFYTRPVAPAGCRLKTLAVEYGYPAAAVSDDTVTLQSGSGKGYGASLHAKHFGEKLVGEQRQIPGFYTIAVHQKITSQPASHVMNVYASGRLRQFCEDDRKIALQSPSQCRMLIQSPPHLFAFQSQGRTRSLHQCTVGAR